MHDPMTVAFQVRRLGIAIWHVDPCVKGDEDSCDWFGTKRNRRNGWVTVVKDEYDRLPKAAQEAVDFLMWHWGAKPRPWWKHPRYHVWHWKVQVNAILNLKRWLFSRCATCGKRFPWGYAPIADGWDSDGPRWFRGERGVRHHYSNIRATCSDTTCSGAKVAKALAHARTDIPALIERGREAEVVQQELQTCLDIMRTGSINLTKYQDEQIAALRAEIERLRQAVPLAVCPYCGARLNAHALAVAQAQREGAK
jgi:hypothetical protein